MSIFQMVLDKLSGKAPSENDVAKKEAPKPKPKAPDRHSPWGGGGRTVSGTDQSPWLTSGRGGGWW